MKNSKSFQENFVSILNQVVSEHNSLADEISDILEISLDGVYRRLRCDTRFSLDETVSLCLHFNIPLELLNQKANKGVTFYVNQLEGTKESYLLYLKNMLDGMKRMNSSEESKVTFAAEDIPVFYHFGFKHLRKFKMAYWMKSLMNISEMQYIEYDEIEILPEMEEVSIEIFDTFCKTHTTEIWTHETIHSTLKQIKFYWDAGFINDIKSIDLILKDFLAMLKVIQRNAALGFKFVNESMGKATYELYLSDLMIGNNSIMVEYTDLAESYISYSGFNFMLTTNQVFNEQNKQWLNNIISKSTLISKVAEKQRFQFFKYLQEEVQNLHAYIRS